MTLQELKVHAEALPVAERGELADFLFASLEEVPEDAAFDEELLRRRADYLAGRDPGIDADELIAGLRNRRR